MKIPNFSFSGDLSQLIYSIIVVLFIPVALAFNSIYILKSDQRDMDYELNNKALLVESAIGIGIRDKISSQSAMQTSLQEMIKTLPEVKAVEAFKIDQDNLSPLVSTSSLTKEVADPTLNSLAWGTDQAYSKQIYATLGSSGSERMWLVASPIHDQDGKKLGVLNIYISASEIDQLSNRTFNDSIFILIITMVVVTLLLINHFRFFEISLMFKKLSELDKLKDDFISMASHELKAPLTAISSYAYVLLRDPVIYSYPKAGHDLNVISQAAARLQSLVEDILDVSRIEQNRLKLEMVPHNLSEIMTGVYNQFLPIAQQKGIKLIYTPGTQSLLVECDKDKIFQIFTNLVSNAIKYTPAGEVGIFHQIVGGEVKTFVKDSGVGISGENRAKLFTKFTRIYNDKTKDVEGTGLGLWITKQLVEKMKGKITVESIQGQGSVFIVSFPCFKV